MFFAVSYTVSCLSCNAPKYWLCRKQTTKIDKIGTWMLTKSGMWAIYQYTVTANSDVFKTEKVLIFVLYSSKLLKKNSRDFWNVSPFSKIQLVVYYQFCILIGWATTRLYVIAHC